jgi:transposase
LKDEGIFMSKNEQFQYRIISEFITGKLKRSEAAELLCKTERTISRMARKQESRGFIGVKHANYGRTPANKILNSEKQKIMKLVEETYFDLNITHCLEKLKNDHEHKLLSYATLRRWCHEKRLVKRKHRRSSKVRKQRVRMPFEGLLLQMDGSHHKWNRKSDWCLIAAIDDATSDIPYAEFFLSEDTLNCMTVMQRILERKGIPEAIYVDKAGCLGGGKRAMFNQFKRACEELGIRIIFANSAQGKGRIERVWDTFQDRIIPELRLRNIHNMPRANEYLQNEFIPNYWKQNNVKPAREAEIKYKELPLNIDLNEIFCLKSYRSVKSDHTFSWNNDVYIIDSDLKYSIHKQKIEIREYQNMTYDFFYAGKKILVSLIESKKIKLAA